MPYATPANTLLRSKSQMLGTRFKQVPTRPIMIEIIIVDLLPFCINLPAEAEPMAMPTNTAAPIKLPQNAYSESVCHPY